MTSPSVPTIRAKGPEDLLALVPYLLGFQPEESITAVLLSGAQLKLTARVDLPPLELLEPALDSFSLRLAEQTVNDDVDQIIVMVFSHDVELAEQVLVDLSGRGGLPVILAMHSDLRQFRILDDEEMSPPQDYDPSMTVAAASAVAAGMAPVASRTDLAELVALDEDCHRAALIGADELGPLDHEVNAVPLMRQTVQRCITDGRSPREIALLALLALDLTARDAALMMMDRGSASEHLGLWLSVARAMRGSLAAGPAALAAMAAWLDGNGALAWCCVDRAEAEFEGYSLAALVAEMLDNAVHPDAWQECRPQLIEAA